MLDKIVDLWEEHLEAWDFTDVGGFLHVVFLEK